MSRPETRSSLNSSLVQDSDGSRSQWRCWFAQMGGNINFFLPKCSRPYSTLLEVLSDHEESVTRGAEVLICDKYDMTHSLMSWSRIWLRAGIESSAPEHFNKLLLIAYILDIPDSFSKLSWEIISRQAGPSVDLPELVDHDLVRRDVLGMPL